MTEEPTEKRIRKASNNGYKRRLDVARMEIDRLKAIITDLRAHIADLEEK